MWPFNTTTGEDSCTGHHFEVDRYYRHEFKFTYDHGVVEMKQKAQLECQHEGCNASKQEWVTVEEGHIEYNRDEQPVAIYNAIRGLSEY